MKSKFAIGLILSFALLGIASGKSENEYVDPSSITSVRFTKKCKAISGSLAQCDGVMITFAAVSFKPQPQGVRIHKKEFGGIELK